VQLLKQTNDPRSIRARALFKRASGRMRLLVSVADADEARAAIVGGADVIDAKDPMRGALGAVELPTMTAIAGVVAGARPVTAALGEPRDAAALAESVLAYANAGAVAVKIGFGGIADAIQIASLIEAASRHVVTVAVAYADDRAGIDAIDLAAVTATAGGHGILVDTVDKAGLGLSALLGREALTALCERAHAAGLFVAIAGRLNVADFEWIAMTGADVVGVRGAACVGGRTGRISEDRVRTLASALRP
jgi:(5-formylfuran-3-yl)methyl phosphate synthase